MAAPARPRQAPLPTVQPGTQATLDTPLERARQEAASCTACDLYRHATQVVFGEGPPDARVMLVGEAPGDQEDRAGHPFVGPAGQVLDRALVEAGIDRREVYVTNAVKHFKFEPRGRFRLHKTPDAGEIAACRFWLALEQRRLRPALTVALGATAARAILGRVVTISRVRGAPMPLPEALSWAEPGSNAVALVTVHPSYLLRLPDEASRTREYAAFVADLRRGAALIA